MNRALFILIVVLGLAPAAVAKTAIAFESGAVVARVTPGASTAWFAIEHTRNGYRLKIFERAMILVDEDGDGIVRFALETPSVRSVWMVVDLGTGDHAIDAPASILPPRRRALPSAALHARQGAGPAQVFQHMSASLLWLVRPGVGAWMTSVEDGSPEDGDGTTNGVTAAVIEKMSPVGSSPPAPGELRRDDVVVSIEPVALHVFDLRVVQ